MALRDLGADFEHHIVCEFNQYAMSSYNAIHGTNFETSDIRNLHGSDLNITDKNQFCYIVTYSFPCQDLSVAGHQKGMSKDNQADEETATRSGLLWEVERILKELHDSNSPMPDVLVMENVTQVHGKRNKADFDGWISSLVSMGYRTNVWQDMNSRNYGVPQNRDRTFMVSIYDPYEEYTFEFPKPIELEHLMVDYLDDVVDEKFYLENERKDKMIENLILEGKLPDPETATLEDLAKAFDIPVDKLIWFFGSEDLRGGGQQLTSHTQTQDLVSMSQTPCPEDRTEEYPQEDKRVQVCCHMNLKRMERVQHSEMSDG